ncbi:glutamate carboxypeptidase [Physcia stellaris]|nr:glutamate carboxypeptidase [Physcia stellaris]
MPKQIKMPPGSPQYLKDLPNNLRVEPRSEPYPKSKPKKSSTSKSSTADKENADAAPKPKSRGTKPKKLPEAQSQYPDWRAISLDETLGEIPCYDNAAAVRRKLKKLLADKDLIPCSDGKKRWTQAAMNAEMEQLERQDGAVEYNRNSNGPTVRTLAAFLKKSGNMGGGDSPSYYWGYVLCEKLRVWEGAKKTKARVEAEVSYQEASSGHDTLADLDARKPNTKSAPLHRKSSAYAIHT